MLGAQNPPAPAPVECPKPAKAAPSTLVIGGIERVVLEPEGLSFEARVDTGAETSSFGATEITEFERDGKPWVSFEAKGRSGKVETVKRPVVRHARIKRHGGESLRRPVVKLRVVLGPLEELREFTLADRSNYEFPVLIGRNYLRDVALVDVGRKNTQKTKRRASSSK